jgi:broad specificity phosphatase PhoE
VNPGRLLLIRHGQTGGNGQRYVGREDVPLDEVGVAQARAIAGALIHEPVDAVYASPLSRAVETARPLAEARALPILVREALREIDYGRYQGLLKTDQPLRLRHDHRFTAMPDGESLHDVFVRVSRFGTELRAGLAAGRSVVVVGHFWSNRMLAAALDDVPFADVFSRTTYKPANGSIYELGCRGTAERASVRWLYPAVEGRNDD